jgi:transcriptional regulator with XRE-family HTH domain
MTAAIKLLDKYKATCYPPQDLQVAKNLRLTHPAVSNWRRGRAHPDAESVEKMAKAIGEPVGPWLAQIEAERARTPAARQVWLRLAATLGTALAVAVIALPHAIEAARSLPIVSNRARPNRRGWYALAA